MGSFVDDLKVVCDEGYTHLGDVPVPRGERDRDVRSTRHELAVYVELDPLLPPSPRSLHFRLYDLHFRESSHRSPHLHWAILFIPSYTLFTVSPQHVAVFRYVVEH